MKQKWRRITSPETTKNFHLIKRCNYVLKIVKRIPYPQQKYIEHLLCVNEKKNNQSMKEMGNYIQSNREL